MQRSSGSRLYKIPNQEGTLLKLIIADDEHRVCQLIENILPWEEYGIHLAGTAHSGVEAFRLIEEVRPDIVVTDIRMPGFDGITLIEKSRVVDPDISFIIVSGYRDFEYAQRALKFGAEDYLLKPVSREDLEQIILRVIQKKTQQEKIHQIEHSLIKEIKLSRETLCRQLAGRFIEKGCRIETSELSRYMDDSFVSFQAKSFQVLILQIDHSNSDQPIDSKKAMDTILQKTEASVAAYIKDHVCEYIYDQRDFSLVYILNLDAELSFRDLEYLHETAAHKVSEYGQWRLTLCSGRVVSRIEDLYKSFEDADWACRDRIFKGCGKILGKRVVPAVEEELKLLDLDQLDNKIMKVIESGEASALKAFFTDEMIPSFILRRISNPDTVLSLFRFAAESFEKQLRAIGAEDSEVKALTAQAERIFFMSGSVERLGGQLSDLYSSSLNGILKSNRMKAYRPIRIAKEYIDSHYAENIDLNTIAREAGFNPVYFSSLFKKETGINFKEYLLQKRIEIAKGLLVSGNDTIGEISLKVGYKDVRYFSRVFSKTVGIKPNMYRKIYA